MSSIVQNQVNLWIEQSRGGNRDAFAEIVKLFQAKVCAVTFSMTGNLQESEDLAQETFLTAWNKLVDLREPEKIGAWLCGIARTLCKKWIHGKYRDPLHAAAQIEPNSTKPVETEEFEESAPEKRQKQAELAWTAIAEIPEQYREPLILYYRENRSVREVAQTLELSETCVKQRLHRGRQYLKQELERLVESALESTRPSEHFVVAVLAAIPILATGPQAIAAGSAGAAAAQSASSSGAGAGPSLFAGISAFFWAFFVNIITVLPIFLGMTLGIWSGIRNAPTLRARQWMLKTTLGYFIAAHLLFFFLFLAMAGINYAVTGSNRDLIPERILLQHLCVGLFCFLMGAAPVAVILSSYFSNRRWRRVVEEDLGLRSNETSSDNSMKSIYVLTGIALGIFVFAFASVLLLEQWPPASFWIGPLGICVFGVSLFFLAVNISKDEKAFAKAPPRFANLLQILTGEEKAPKGFRNRINFWGDLTGIGWGMFIIQVGSIGWYFQHKGLPDMSLFGLPIGNGYNVLLTLSLLIYLIFAVFFAGIPRKRYYGMIFLGSCVFACNMFMCCYAKIWEHVYRFEFAMVFGLNFWYLLCFILLGVAGLLAFRREKPNFA